MRKFVSHTSAQLENRRPVTPANCPKTPLQTTNARTVRLGISSTRFKPVCHSFANAVLVSFATLAFPLNYGKRTTNALPATQAISSLRTKLV